MKVFAAIILALVAGASAAAADEQVDPETCLNTLNDLTKDYVPHNGLKDLVSKLETVVDLQKVIELNLGEKFNVTLDSMRYIMTVPYELLACELLGDDMDKLMDQEKTCLPKMKWISRQNVDAVMSGSFGAFLKYFYACSITNVPKIDDAF